MGDRTEQVGDARSHWLIERRVRVYPRIFLAMFLLAAPAYALTFSGGLDGRGRPAGTDFIAFWSAGRLALDGQADDAWDLGFIGAFQLDAFPGLSGPTQWAYPPTTLPLVTPFGALPYLVGFTAWVVIGLVVFVTALAPLLRGRPHAWPLALAFPGLWLGIPSGQIQFFVAGLMGGALVLLPRRAWLSGVLIGLLVIKPQLAVLLPLVLVAGRAWTTFVAAAVTAMTASVASLVAYGASAYESWWRSLGVLGDAISDGTAPVYKFVTPYMGLRLLGLPEVPALVLHVAVAGAAALVVWKVWRSTDDPMLRGASAVTGTFLVTPYAADYDLLVLAFPIAWLAIRGSEEGWYRGDRNLLALTWMLPAIAAPIAVLTHVTIVPFVMGFLLRQLWLRCQQETPQVPQVVGGT